MEAKELRVGNSILLDGKITTVVDVDLLVVMTYNNIKADGIEITPAILEKAGFEKYNWPEFYDYTHFQKDELIVRFHHDGASVFNASKCNAAKKQFIKSVRYLHEFQNGYYFLTGEELEINL